MSTELPPGVHSFRPTENPLAEWPEEVPIPFDLVDPGDAPSSALPARVANWDYYDGAIVMVGVSDGKTFTIEGSGVMVAPGLVLSATHVLRDHADAIDERRLSVFCIGLRREGKADLWAVRRSLRFAEDESDIMFLGVELNSELSEDWYVPCLPITTRAPRKGEILTILGYRFAREQPTPLPIVGGVPVLGRGDLYLAAGALQELYYPRRDSVLAPFPALEIDCGALGSMSGGAVLDAGGALVGIISRGWGDGGPPATAAWIVHALLFDVTIPWPPGAYPPDSPILELPDDRLTIYGRDKVRITGPMEIEYTCW